MVRTMPFFCFLYLDVPVISRRGVPINVYVTQFMNDNDSASEQL